MQHVKNNSITLLSDTFHLAVLKIIPIAKAIPHRVGKACISPGCFITKCGAVNASIINKHCINLLDLVLQTKQLFDKNPKERKTYNCRDYYNNPIMLQKHSYCINSSQRYS